MSWSRDYRGYIVEPPCRGFQSKWRGMPTINGFPWITASSEGELRESIDYAHEARGNPLPHSPLPEGGQRE